MAMNPGQGPAIDPMAIRRLLEQRMAAQQGAGMQQGAGVPMQGQPPMQPGMQPGMPGMTPDATGSPTQPANLDSMMKLQALRSMLMQKAKGPQMLRGVSSGQGQTMGNMAPEENRMGGAKADSKTKNAVARRLEKSRKGAKGNSNSKSGQGAY